MVNEIEDERTLTPRDPWLVGAATAVPLLFFSVAGLIVASIVGLACVGVEGGGNRCGAAVALVALAFPVAPALVLVGGVLTSRRASWRWLGVGALLAGACLGLPWLAIVA